MVTPQDNARAGLDEPAHLAALLYTELRALAAAHMQRETSGGHNHTLQPTALAHEAFLRLSTQRNLDWSNRDQFFALAARIIRRVLVDHAKSRGRIKRGGENCRVTLCESSEPILRSHDADLLALDDALSMLAARDPRAAEIAEMKLFSDLTLDQIAARLDVSRATVAADWSIARALLNRELADHEPDGASPPP